MKPALFLAILIFLTACQSKEKDMPPKITASSACMPQITDKEWYSKDQVAPLFEGLGDWEFKVTTKDSLVQRYVSQGLILAYGFNHAEAARSFYYAAKLDSTCAMAHWGFAYVLGPNYNAGMESDNYERAYAAIEKALAIPEANITPRERAMIEALSKRYAAAPVEDRAPLDEAYRQAMESLYKSYPDDADIGSLYAEAIMNLHPWDLFDKEGVEKPWTGPIISTLENVLEKYPNHPGANHFYIHATEMSNTPEMANSSAERFLNGIVPNAGHLLHMPSHVYIRSGEYHKGTLSNILAIKADSTYTTACHAQGAYPLGYFPHNQHFMAATATLEGNSKMALYAADAVSKNTSVALMKEPGWGTIQHYYTIPFNVYVKFGKWDEILAMENKAADLLYPTAIHHYSKGMAYLGKNNLEAARKELEQLSVIATKEELKEITIWEINSVFDLVQIAEKVLLGNIQAKEENWEMSVATFREAIEMEDNLNYNEPPDWFFSVRHYLGDVLLKSGKFDEAVIVYSEDLKTFPKNGWALKGLSLAYKGLQDQSHYDEFNSKFEAAWATADINLLGSVIH